MLLTIIDTIAQKPGRTDRTRRRYPEMGEAFMKEVFSTVDPLEAHLVRSLLERNGIASEVHGDKPYYPYLGQIPSDMMPSVWIIEDDQLQRAAAFVAEYQRVEHNSKL